MSHWSGSHTLELSGHSDDVLCVVIDGRHDELSGGVEVGGITVWRLLVSWAEGRVRVTAIYDGCWSFAVSKVDEEDDVLVTAVSRRWSTYTEVLSFQFNSRPIVVQEQLSLLA